jgi:DNA-binding CsgD family transcriptional regulator
MFKLGQDSLTAIGSYGDLSRTAVALENTSLYTDGKYWRRDPAIHTARTHLESQIPILIVFNVEDLEDDSFRERIYERSHIVERAFLCSGTSDRAFGLSVVRSERRGHFEAKDLSRLCSITPIILSMLSKHIEVLERAAELVTSLSSLPAITQCISRASFDLTKRESQVCARIIYGMSSVGISLDLAIGEESVMTYRKRAYSRLHIATHRELLLWYLDQRTAQASMDCSIEKISRPATSLVQETRLVRVNRDRRTTWSPGLGNLLNA